MTMAGVTGLSLLLVVAVVGRVSLAYTTTGRTRDWYYDTTTRAPTQYWGYTSPDRPATYGGRYATTGGTSEDWRYLTSTNSACGGYYSSWSGVVTSPNYPSNYPNYANCEYIIDTGAYVSLRVDTMSLESCCDHVKVMDRYGSVYDNISANTIPITNNYFRIVFTSDGSNTFKGFRLFWSLGKGDIDQLHLDNCGTKYSSSLSGYITSPNYPSDYYNNAQCEYVISPGTYVYLRVIDKDLEACCDHLVIYDDQGNNVTGNYYLYGKYFRVVFTSDGSAVRRGFKLYYGPDYSSLPAYLTTDSSYNSQPSSPYPWYGMTSPPPWYDTTTNEACGQTSYSTSGVFTSPNYPSNYFNNLNCVYYVLTSTYSELSIDDMILEDGYDHLKINYEDPYRNRQMRSFTGTSRGTIIGRYFDITFTTDGSNTNRGFKLSWRLSYDATLTYGYGYTTNEYYQSSSNWWGWSSKAPFGKVMVTCDSRDFKVTVPRDMIQQVFPGSSEYDLTLDDPNCRGQVYYDVVMFRSNILGCGMTREETGSDIVYKNRIVTQSRGYYGSTTTGPIITRFNSKDIALECHLNRDVSIVGHFRPQHDHELVVRGSGNFSMHMDFYRDPSFSYRITSYPIYIGLNQNVYVDVGLESDDSDLKISLQNCVAKPTVNPYDYYNQYYLIRDGCPADQTVAFEYTSSQKHVHFRFRTFEFVRNNRDVYIFCYVRVCNGTDYDQRCRRDCYSPHRQGRDVSDDRKDHDLHIFQGPLTFREKRNADFQVAERTDEKDSSSAGTVSAIVMVIAAVAMVMAAVVMVIRGKRRNRSHTTGVDTEL
ncbi:scavenger receptor cysteine-rich domain-containing protein DMBT1-like [Haliotis cracherodii]|uniref:scavenger receptor cysteine-rich domain-containing protein DMBT1-like n=1 Tax=Haliotis cracherodii TaxID=6455 RepID=UPI0039EAFEC0